MTYTDDALDALAQIGHWVGPATPEAEVIRVEIRRAARRRGIKVRTGIGSAGLVYALTPDGFPGEEPWRGAAIHAHESGAGDQMVAAALSALYPKQ